MLISKRLMLIIIFRTDPEFHEMAKDEMYQYIDAIRTEIAIVAGDEATAPENQNLRETLNTTHTLKQRLTQAFGPLGLCGFGIAAAVFTCIPHVFS